MDGNLSPERLAQQLRDERRLRDAAEQKAAKQATSARLWRDRAEERAQRIERLVEERDRLTRLPVRLRAMTARALKDGRPMPGTASPSGTPMGTPRATDPPPQQPMGRTERHLAHVQLGSHIGSPDLRRVIDQCTVHDIAEEGSGLFEADAIVIEQSAFRSSGTDLQERLVAWMALDARQPLVWIGPEPPPDAAAQGRTVHLTPTDQVLPATFDPSLHNPIRRDGHAPPGPVIGDQSDNSATDWDPQDPDQLARAARAEPVPGVPDPVRAGDNRRRHVWAHHTPGVAARALLAAAGLSLEEPTPSVAAILVSNRPDDLRHQITAITDQAHPALELRIGCHGFSSREVAAAVDEASHTHPVEVLDLPADRELGWCLNRTIEDCGASVLAKIDDDDHYGPGYLVDALQALEYSGADLVGRVCSFTYLEGEDRTVLRRLGDEEMFYEGTLIGATMVFRRSAWERAPFAHKTLAEDVSFQRSIRATGGRVYVASRWDFVYRRRIQGNTWRAPDEHFLAHAQDAWAGWGPTRADLEAP